MPSTARTMPSSVGNCTRRSSTRRRGGCMLTGQAPRLISPRTMALGRSRVAHPWVEERIADVHEDVGDDDEYRREQYGALDDREIGVGYRDVVQPPDPGDVEDRFNQYG